MHECLLIGENIKLMHVYAACLKRGTQQRSGSQNPLLYSLKSSESFRSKHVRVCVRVNTDQYFDLFSLIEREALNPAVSIAGIKLKHLASACW